MKEELPLVSLPSFFRRAISSAPTNSNRIRRRRPPPALPRPCLEELTQRIVLSVPTPDHVVVVMEENHGYSQIIGDTTDAPYINNTLVKNGALFTNSYAVSHPSEPNYLALFSGDTQGVTDDGTYTFNAANLASELSDNNLTFAGYSEDLPYSGYTGDSYNSYVRKHAPWVSFSNLDSSVSQPFSSFPSDYSTLPTVSVVVPNLNNDMHDGTISDGDTWLSNNIDGYAQWAQSHNSLLIVTWDEDDSSTSANQIATIFVGQMVQQGTYSETINHYNVLRTIEDMYGLSYMNNEANVSTISDCWTGTPPASPSGLTAATPSSSQVTLSWTSNSTNQTGFKVERATSSDFTQGLDQLGTTAANVTSYTDSSASPATTYYYRVRATDAFGDSQNSNTAGVMTLPLTWFASDVGGPGVGGSTSYDGTTWTVSGGGSDIWSAPDQFQYASQSVSGDSTIVAQVTSVSNSNAGAKAGVMFRDGIGSGTNYFAVLENPNGQVEMQWRDTAGADSNWNGAQVGDTGGPKWLKIVRSGDSFSGYYAETTGTPSDSDWVQIDTSHTVAMSAATAGLAVTAGDNTAVCTATFTNVSVTGQWVQTTAADFSAGATDGTTVTNTAGGEVQLADSVPSGTFTSGIFDAARLVTWGTASWTAGVPDGTTLVVETRSGNTATPDSNWSAWAAVTNGQIVASPGARYFQYRVTLTSTSDSLSPVLYDITFNWS